MKLKNLASFILGLCLMGCPLGDKPKEGKPASNLVGDREDNSYGSFYEQRIGIKSGGDVDQKRTQLKRYLFKADADFFHRFLPNKVFVDYRGKLSPQFTGLQRIDRLRVEMAYGVDSEIFLFHPSKKTEALMVIHEGHYRHVWRSIPIIQTFLNKGVTVLALAMPLTQPNSQPDIELKRFGKIQLVDHSQLVLLESKDFSPLSFFVTPIVASLNYCLQEYSFSKVGMMGLSGGGWSTTVYAALDSRIERSYPVAGSLPFEARKVSDGDWGDYEQYQKDFYQMANYYELYVMGAYGKGRRQIQILNQYDPCCFKGEKGKFYENELKKGLSSLGPGEFDLVIDSSHKQHEISGEALSLIIQDFLGKADKKP